MALALSLALSTDLVLFVMLCFLEDCGYAKAVLRDTWTACSVALACPASPSFHFLISSGCGVPGVLSTRTVSRRINMTAMLTTMIPLLPHSSQSLLLVMGVLIGSSSAWWSCSCFLLLGVAMIVISAVMLKTT